MTGPPVRWWPAALILAIGAGLLTYIWLRDAPIVQDRVVPSFPVLFFTALALFLWLLLSSRLPGRRRWRIFVATTLTVGAGFLLLEIKGVDGNLVPIVGLRWRGEQRFAPVDGAAAGVTAPGAAWSAWRSRPVARFWARGERARFETTVGGRGPRATPTIADGRVFALGGGGSLRALALDTGRLIWSRDVLADNGASLPSWGMSSSPLVVGEVVLIQHVLPGGRIHSKIPPPPFPRSSKVGRLDLAFPLLS